MSEDVGEKGGETGFMPISQPSLAEEECHVRKPEGVSYNIEGVLPREGVPPQNPVAGRVRRV